MATVVWQIASQEQPKQAHAPHVPAQWAQVQSWFPASRLASQPADTETDTQDTHEHLELFPRTDAINDPG